MYRMKDVLVRRIPDVLALCLALYVQFWLASYLTRRYPARALLWRRLKWVFCAWVAFGFSPSMLVPYWGILPWVKAGGFTWAILSSVMWLVLLASEYLERMAPVFSPGRRRVLQVGRTAALAAPAAVLGYGVWVERENLQLREVNIAIPGLAPDLQGLRIVQITDIHLSPFFTPRDLERAIGMANETKAHIALVTGDLVTVRRDPLELCISMLRNLKADAPVLGCLGNHEISAQCEDEATRLGQAAGIRFLRSEAQELRFGQASLNFVGVDYQRKFSPYLVGAEDLRKPGMPNILLSHNPDVFPVAAEKEFDLTIAGHTHGGQISVEVLGDSVNVARFYTPYIHGEYRIGNRSIYVSRGLGTVGMPARVGAPPEVTLIKLCATSS